jgi:hypothetical protein
MKDVQLASLSVEREQKPLVRDPDNERIVLAAKVKQFKSSSSILI